MPLPMPRHDGRVHDRASTAGARDAAMARLASAVRDLGHASLAHDLSTDQLAVLADSVEDLAARAAGAQRRPRDLDRLAEQFFPVDVVDGARVVHFDDCFVSGPHNPLGIGLDVHVDGDEVVGTVTLGRAHEGAPDRSHGGVVAAVFDDVLGYLLSVNHILGFTGELTVRYLAPTPIGVPVTFRARMLERRARTLDTAGEATTEDGTVVATASAVFVQVLRDEPA